jgi:hypothetical protein
MKHSLCRELSLVQAEDNATPPVSGRLQNYQKSMKMREGGEPLAIRQDFRSAATKT